MAVAFMVEAVEWRVERCGREGRVVIAGGRRVDFEFDGGEKKSLRSAAKADLIDFVSSGRVLGTASERGVERAMSRAAARRESTVW